MNSIVSAWYEEKKHIPLKDEMFDIVTIWKDKVNAK
jgi:hypothetical protein